MMQRKACFEQIRDLRDGAIVVSTYTSAFEWRRVDPSPLNFVSVGAMGQASSHALGLAIGLPHEKIMRNIELLGTKVVPELEKRGHRVDYSRLAG